LGAADMRLVDVLGDVNEMGVEPGEDYLRF
jgi:hypothetical protein